jgi:hypothetical protein
VSVFLIVASLAVQASAQTCERAADHPKIKALTSRMALLSRHAAPVWNGYVPFESAYVFVVEIDGGWCGVLWSNARTRILALPREPRLSTPMYGFHFGRLSGTDRALRDGWTQPDEIVRVLSDAGADRAVLVPVAPNIKLPFEISDAQLFDLALHEAFHVTAQAPAWLGARGEHAWPAWDRPQPDRRALGSTCYQAPAGMTDRSSLERAAAAVLDHRDVPAVCAEATAFIAARRARWANLAASTVAAVEGPAMSCEQAEAIMELDEGVADFVAWMTALESGNVTARRVKQRFAADQADVFYLTGAMQLVVLRRLAGSAFADITRDIATSSTWQSGNIFGRLEREVDARCGAQQH